jgi:hypothetical protein
VGRAESGAVLSTAASGLTSAKSRYSLEQHERAAYLDALRPAGLPTEFGE